MIDHQCFAEALTAIELPLKKSNRGYEPEQLVTQFSISVWCAANRFEYAEVTRHAPVLRELFGFKTMANFQAIMGLFKRFSQQDNDRISGDLYGFLFGQLKLEVLALNLDHTDMTRDRQQMWVSTSNNPAKRGESPTPPLNGLYLRYTHDRRQLAAPWERLRV
jgi:hypothetical protein